jgi:hypothetical protein
MTSTAHRTELSGRHRRAGRLAAACVLPLAVAVVSAGCGGAASPTATSASTPTSGSAPASTATAPLAADPTINPRAALTQTVDAGFDPPFTLRIPAHWTAVLRDVSAFQAYAGNEEFEITFDHTYRSRESVAHAITRLTRTDGLTPGPVTDVVIGGSQGKGFMASSQSAVMFVNSGFHTNQGSRLEVFVIPVKDGTTVTVFLTAEGDPTHGLDALGPLARRIFQTVDWR